LCECGHTDQYRREGRDDETRELAHNASQVTLAGSDMAIKKGLASGR
jgi:hypothetical protein